MMSDARINNPYAELDGQVRALPSPRRCPFPSDRGSLAQPTDTTYAPVADVDGLPSPSFPSQIEQLLSGVIISEEEVRVICEKAKEVLSKEENVVPVAAPVTVVRPNPGGPSIFPARGASRRVSRFLYTLEADGVRTPPLRVIRSTLRRVISPPLAFALPASTPSPPSPFPPALVQVETFTASSPTWWS